MQSFQPQKVVPLAEGCLHGFCARPATLAMTSSLEPQCRQFCCLMLARLIWLACLWPLTPMLVCMSCMPKSLLQQRQQRPC